ncbi:MAG: hypothetical protein GY730_04260 [bacterium]|nr:hypothetical protein [bacterium]
MMGVNAAGSSPVQGRQLAEQINTADQLADTMQDISNAMKGLNDTIFDTESQGVTKDMAGKKADRNDSANLKQQQVQLKGVPGEEIIAEILALLAADTLEKKKKTRKKTAFEEKMAELAELLPFLETSGLSEEDKAAVETFKENIHSLKKRQSELVQITNREIYYEELLEEKEKKEKRS